MLYFNSRPSARGDAPCSRVHSSHVHFNSRPSARGDSHRRSSRKPSGDFNSRPSARGDDSYRRHYRGVDEFQFTPLREGRRQQRQRWLDYQAISIHAPPRGATRTTKRYFPQDKIFQFTPLREGRRAFDAVYNPITHFNSRPSARGDSSLLRAICSWTSFQFTPLREGRRYALSRGGRGGGISIHAPPRGATLYIVANITLNLISIHAPPRGATLSRLI